MSHKLHDITLYYFDDAGDQSKRFTVRQNVVSDLYVHFLESYKPPKTTRISIMLKNPGEAINQTHYSGSIVIGDVSFDKTAFWNASADDQKRMILDVTHSFAIRCAGEFRWDKTVFNRAYQRVLDANYIFKTESRPKFSPDRRLKAALMIEKNEEKTVISASIYHSTGKKLTTIPLFESFQNEMFYGGLVKNFKWFSKHEFGVYSKAGQIKIIADLKTCTSRTSLEPKTTSREILEGQLRRILFADLKTQADIVAWMNR